jgi:putative Mg2+ transporter-C (MgtC) family protein
MQTLSIAEFVLRLGVGVGCGALIGIERQWQARRAGLRTNALVATGATLFVLYSVVTNDSSPTRVASYVVSGVGFLGGGVILREGFNVRGLNTAATLWCSAAVGVLAAGGHPLFALTGTVVGIHLLGRPLGHLIDHGDSVVEEDEDDQPYQLQLICRRKSEKYARAQIVQRTGGGGDRLVLRGIHTGRAGDDAVLTAYLLSDGHAPARLEQLVAELSLQEGVQAVHWYAGDEDEPMPRAPYMD